MLLFLAENDRGLTFLGIEPILGLDPEAREGTRSVGPFTALWYAIFMIPFFLWVREGPGPLRRPRVGRGLSDLGRTLRRLPASRWKTETARTVGSRHRPRSPCRSVRRNPI